MLSLDPAIDDLQRRLQADCQKGLCLPSPYRYYDGAPVGTVVPLDTAQEQVMIIGAYPSARFATVRGVPYVPIGDVGRPFPEKMHMAGGEAWTVPSGRELRERYLVPLGLSREQCWITNLVRVFLFQKWHAVKSRQLEPSWTGEETRSRFECLAKEGKGWLGEELAIARPRIVITLGAEAAGILRGVKGQQPRNALLGGTVQEMAVGGIAYPVIHLAHPGILMRRGSASNPWPERHKEHIQAARRVLEEMGLVPPGAA
jgi:uracil-DNA glycosylase